MGPICLRRFRKKDTIGETDADSNTVASFIVPNGSLLSEFIYGVSFFVSLSKNKGKHLGLKYHNGSV